MTRSLPRHWSLLAALAVLALVALTVAVPPWAAADDDAHEVRGATLTWALNDEIGNAGLAPGTRNFLHAGAVPDPGQGGWTMPQSAWRSSAGSVTIEKPDASGTYREATWDVLRTTPTGAPVTAPFDNNVSKIRVRIDDGTGSYDPATGRASLSWNGTFGVVLYSGLSFFNVSDVRLDVANGTGTLSGTLDGFEGSPSDPTLWRPIPATRVVLAELPDVEVTGGGAAGTPIQVTAAPAYAGVRYDAGADGTAQVRTGAGWGAWPASYVQYQARLGTAEYWYSTGAATDRFKAPRPVGASFSIDADTTPVDPTDPEDTGDPTDPADPNDPKDPADPKDPSDPRPGPTRGKLPFTVTDAQLRWGMSKEAGNAAHLPGTVNLFSAGELPAGASTLKQREWRARAGNVRIEKRGADGRYGPATWAGLSTTPTGASVAPASSDAFSDHQVVIGRGTGRVDPRRGTATIRWDGTWSVAFYSGLSRFAISDPELRVRNGRGRLLGTLSGYAGDREDAMAGKEGALTPVPSQRVVLAHLGKVRLDGRRGFVVTPRYDRVRYTAKGAASPQVRTGPWGAFPQGFVDFLEPVGVAGFWYSTGGSTDRLKAALPLTVNYRATAPVQQPKPEQPAPGDGGTTNGGLPEVDGPGAGGSTEPSPQSSGPVAPGSAALPAALPSTGLPGLPGLSGVPLYGGSPATVTAAPLTLRAAQAPDASGALPWALGTGLLALAGALALTAPRQPRRPSP